MSFVRFVAISLSASGTATIASGIANTKLRLVQQWITATGSGRLGWKSDGTILNGTQRINIQAAQVLPYNGYGWVETATGEALRLTASASAVEGVVAYREVI